MLRFAFDAVLGCACEIRLVIEERLQHCARVVQRKTNAKGEQARQKKNLFHPRSRMQLPLRANIKNRYRD